MQDRNIYENRIIAFVDVLGFKNMIDESCNDTELQNLVKSALERIYDTKLLNDRSMQKFGVQVSTFSDSAVISYPLCYDGGLFMVLIDLIHLQIDLMMSGIFLRGGVCIGLVYHDSINVFGPAMVQAYYLESKVANYPRIIIEEQTILEGIKNSPTHQNDFDVSILMSLLQKDMDGYYFLDFLRQPQELNNPELDYPALLWNIEYFINYNLEKYRDDDKIRSKYEWFYKYYKSIVDASN